MFAKPEGAKPPDQPDYGGGDDDDECGYAEADEPPSVVLGENVNTASPFSKEIELQVDKLKVDKPDNLKKSCGNGRVSINKAELVPGKVTYKVIFRNTIGKTLFDTDLNWKFSKVKVVEEKANKNQLKILTVKFDYTSK